MLIPTTGGIDVTIIGANFGAHAEFLDSFRQVDAFNLYRI